MSDQAAIKRNEEITVKQIEDQKLFVRRYVAFQLSKDQMTPDSQAIVPYDSEVN